MADAKIVVSAQDNASRVLAQVRGSLDQVQTVADRVGTALGLIGVAGVGGLVAMAKATIDGVDALNDLKDASGASIENISALEDVAARTGTSFDTVSTALVKFNGVLKEASPGSNTEAVLKAIGLNAKELKEMDPAEALLQTAKALNSFADDGQKARITQELFGKSLKEVAPFLKDLADKGALVAKVTSQQADEAEKFNKQLFEFKKNSIDAGRALSIDLVYGINAAAKAYRESGLWEGLKTFFTGDAQHKSNVRLVELTNELLPLENEINTLRGSASALDKAQLRHKEERLKVLRKEIDVTLEYRKTFDPPPEVSKPSAPDIPEKPSKGSSGKTQAQKDKEELQRERIRMERKVAMDAGDAVTAANDAYQKNLLDQQAATEKYIDTLMREEFAQKQSNQKLREAAEEIGLTKEQVNALHLARLDSNIALEEQNQLTREELGVSADLLNIYQRRLDLMREQRDITARAQIAQANEDTRKEQEQASKEFAKGVHQDLKGALSTAFRDTKDPLGAFGDALANVVYSRAATALAEAMATQAMSAMGGGDALASVFSIFGFENGGVMSSRGALPLQAYANGGVATGPQLALFGEGRMNEAFVPLPDGRSIPVSLQGGGENITVNQPLVINAPNAGPETVAQIANLMPSLLVQNKRVIESVIQQAMVRRGGRLA